MSAGPKVTQVNIINTSSERIGIGRQRRHMDIKGLTLGMLGITLTLRYPTTTMFWVLTGSGLYY